MKNWKLLAGLSGAVAAVVAIIIGCSSDSAATYPTYSYGGPGSEYTATLSDAGTFSITHAPTVGAAVDLTVTGSYSRLTSGFVKLTVGAVTGSGGPSVGDTAYGLEIPGFAFLLKPVGGDSNIIPMVVAGTCPTADFTANWIIGDKDDGVNADDNTADFFGTFAYNHGSVTANLPTKYALEGFTSLGAGTVNGLGACSNGVLEFTGGAMWLTALGGALVHASGSGPTDDQVIIAMPTTAISDAANLAGNYAGLVFNKQAGSGSGDRLFPVSISLTAPTSSTMAGVGYKVTDVDTNTLSSDSAGFAITALDSPSSGFMTGTVTISAVSEEMACMGSANIVGSGKNMIFCVAQSPGDDQEPFNMLLVSK